MTLSELKEEVDAAIERAIEHGESPDSVAVSLQIDGLSGDVPGEASVWARDSIELHYDNNGQASGCVLVGCPAELD